MQYNTKQISGHIKQQTGGKQFAAGNQSALKMM